MDNLAASAFPPHAVAIVGFSGRFPGSADLDDFWRKLMSGVDTLQTFEDADLDAAGVSPDLRSDPDYVRAGTVLEDAEMFDAAFFGLSPREAQILDPQHRIFLQCAWEALEHAGYGCGTSDLGVGVYAGCSMNTHLMQLLKDPALIDSVGGYQLMLANDKDFLCTRVSYKLDLRGPSMSIQTACSTSLVAVVEACRSLARWECDLALAGGVSINFPQRAGYLYQEGMILSPDGRCRPFDAAARGTRGGAGAGIVVLKRLANALADRDTIHAVIRGAAVNNDGAAKAGYTAPSVEGQVEVIVSAMTLAGVSPRSIEYVETHGTGTPLGDPIEIAALRRAFQTGTSEAGFCRLGALKANIGHLDAAAGVAGLIKTVLALKHRELPPLAHFKEPNPEIQLENSPFYASAESARWESDSPRRAGVSSFGIGGTNAHVVLEEAPQGRSPIARRDENLLMISAKTPDGLLRTAENLANWLGHHPEQALADVAWTLQAGRSAFPYRRAIVARSAADAIEALRSINRTMVLHNEGIRSVAFLFSGQGSQHSGMGWGVYQSELVYREHFDKCAEVLEPLLGQDLRSIFCAPASHKSVERTAIAQPALFATEYSLARLWMAWGVTPKVMLGHSIGEYVAACLAGVFSLEDALRIVALRGQLMQAMPEGNMATVALSSEKLLPWLADGVEIAAENGHELCTVAGPIDGIQNLLSRIAAAGIESTKLHVSHAFHSAMMEPVMPRFQKALEEITLHPPAIPYVSNLSGTWITAKEATSPTYYCEHLRRTVRFDSGVRTILGSDPDMAFLEVGPGRTLASLTRAIVGRDRAARVVSSLPHPKEAQSCDATLLSAAGQLWTIGALPVAGRLHAGAGHQRVPLPTYPFELKRYTAEPSLSLAPRDASKQAVASQPSAFAVTWTRCPGSPEPYMRVSGRWLVIGGPESLRTRTADALRAVGAVVDTFESADAEFEDPAAVAGAFALFPLERSGAEHALETYFDIIRIAERLETWNRTQAARLIAITAGACSVLDEQIADPFAAMLSGPIMALPFECSGLELRQVDLDPSAWKQQIDVAIRNLVEEAATIGNKAFVAWRRGRRFVREFRRIDGLSEITAPLPLAQGGTVLITGGMGGIGFTLALWLARMSAARLILVSRRISPEDSTRATREIQSAGGEVMLAAADVCDRKAMARVIAEATERFGAISAVIHSAGTAGSGAISFMKKEGDVREVFDAKVQGLRALIDLLGDQPLSFFAVMSSINGVIGAPGLSDYSGANAVLDAFVESAAKPKDWGRVCSVAWAPWRDVGMAARMLQTARNRDKMERARISLAPDAAVDMFARLLRSAIPHGVVARTDLTAWTPPPLVDQAADEPKSVAQPGHKEELARTVPFEEPANELERQLAEIWAAMLGVEAVGANDDFLDLGGHSLLATRVLSRIGSRLAVRLTLRDIFEAPTVRKLATRIANTDREELVF